MICAQQEKYKLLRRTHAAPIWSNNLRTTTPSCIPCYINIFSQQFYKVGIRLPITPVKFDSVNENDFLCTYRAN